MVDLYGNDTYRLARIIEKHYEYANNKMITINNNKMIAINNNKNICNKND
jgi:hypothetical protein